MDIIPITHLKKRKIVSEEGENLSSFDEISEQIDKNELIYVLDNDGIEKDKPNLCLYQKLSESYNLWIDAGPRVLGDVVDIVMAGAINITIRRKLWHDVDVSNIREITESKIYADIDFISQEGYKTAVSPFYDVDGLVIFDKRRQVERDFKYGGFLRNLSTKYKIYAYESYSKNISYWKNLGITGLLVDISKIKEF